MKAVELQAEPMTADAYHDDMSSDSHSSLQLFRASRERYEAIRVRQVLKPDPPTQAMLFGSLFHTLVLEPDLFAKHYACGPRVDKRTTAGKAEWAAFMEANQGRTLIDLDDMCRAKAMREGLLRNKHARDALEAHGVNERPVFWTDAATGLRLKCRPDRFLDSGLVVDIKTTDDISPEAFSRSVFNLGYHRQAAIYMSGLFARGQECPFLFIAVSKQAPHESVCYLLTDRAAEMGRQDNTDTLRELAGCKLSGDYSGRWGGDIQTLDLPAWAFSRR